jgi:hypothetical protein
MDQWRPIPPNESLGLPVAHPQALERIMTADETTDNRSPLTGDWIFSDEYHRWQDRNRQIGYRHGHQRVAEYSGWYVGLFSIKTDETAKSDMANWPEPGRRNDLEGPYWTDGP